MERLRCSLPWLVRYPIWRAREFCTPARDSGPTEHLIFVVANHFEPGWNEQNRTLSTATQHARLEHWCKRARQIGLAVQDHDGTPFRHTYFYPAEQYDSALLERMAELQAEGLGEVEIHLHHGVYRPDTPQSLRQSLEQFRDLLAEKHRCLSRWSGVGSPRYAFVHGNWALANAAGGQCCGVDSEMQILADTGCYADLTLPSAPHRSQVPRINAIYECGRPLTERAPHRCGPDLRAGKRPSLPILLTGPLVFVRQTGRHGIPMLRLDNGALAATYALDLRRLQRWRSTRIVVRGRPDWIFVKLYCHGFFPQDEDTVIGERMRRFWGEVLDLAERTGQFRIHFATAREAFNMALAAIDGCTGDPGRYRDYKLTPIMSADQQARESSTSAAPLSDGPILRSGRGKPGGDWTA